MKRLWILILISSCTYLTERNQPLVTDACGVDEPVPIDAPPEIDAAPDAPPPTGKALVVLLHGFGRTGAQAASMWRASYLPTADVEVISPTAPYNRWDSSNGLCCPSDQGGNVATVEAIVTNRLAQGGIDPTRVYIWGNSNGASMAWRMMCARPGLFKAAVLIAGVANSATDPVCEDGAPVSILHVHATADASLHYAQPDYFTAYPMPDMYTAAVGNFTPASAIEQERELADCTGTLDVTGKAGALMLSVSKDIDVMKWSGGCTHGYAEHWRINGGEHTPSLTPAWPTAVLAWSDAHKTP